MRKHYCGACDRYLPTEVCGVHGTKHTVLVESKPVVSEPGEAEAGRSRGPLVAELPAPEGSGGIGNLQSARRPTTPHALPVHGPSRVTLARNGPGPMSAREILRFRTSERMLHWAIAIPFMICWLSALILVLVYNPAPTRPLRDLFSWIHRISGVSLILFPAIVVFRGRDEYRIHISNIKCAWLWSLADLKWLALMGLAAVTKKVVLPDQGKFNAAEKVNFMSVMVACPIFILTGLLIWLQEMSWIAWLIHGSLALLVSPIMLGHIYMATLNPETKRGLKGMISGYVDRQWVRHHYPLWYRENFEKKESRQAPPQPSPLPHVLPPDYRLHVHCPTCADAIPVSWGWLLQKIFSRKLMVCPDCGAQFPAHHAVTDRQQLEMVLRHFESGAPVPP